MKYNTEVFQKQFPLVKWFVYHFMYYRQLKRHEARFGESGFWVFTTDAQIMQAAIYWCMVFGARGSNPTHWRNLASSKEDEREIRSTFTKAVLEQMQFTESEWKKYWEGMVEFRNKYAVHRDKFEGVVPHFDKALEIVYAYDDWIRCIFPGIWEEPRLEHSAEEVRREIGPYLEKLFDAIK